MSLDVTLTYCYGYETFLERQVKENSPPVYIVKAGKIQLVSAAVQFSAQYVKSTLGR